MSPQSPKLLDQVAATLRSRHFPAVTSEAYLAWIRRFILCLRVQDLDFERRAIFVRDAKGDEDRATTYTRPDSHGPADGQARRMRSRIHERPGV